MNLLHVQKLITHTERVMRGFRISRDRETGKPTGWMQPDNCRELDLTEVHEALKLVKADMEYEYLQGSQSLPQPDLENNLEAIVGENLTNELRSLKCPECHEALGHKVDCSRNMGDGVAYSSSKGPVNFIRNWREENLEVQAPSNSGGESAAVTCPLHNHEHLLDRKPDGSAYYCHRQSRYLYIEKAPLAASTVSEKEDVEAMSGFGGLSSVPRQGNQVHFKCQKHGLKVERCCELATGIDGEEKCLECETIGESFCPDHASLSVEGKTEILRYSDEIYRSIVPPHCVKIINLGRHVAGL